MLDKPPDSEILAHNIKKRESMETYTGGKDLLQKRKSIISGKKFNR